MARPASSAFAFTMEAARSFRSRPDDLQPRKWMRLALKGNPTILLLLFTPEDQLVHCDALGRELRSLAPQIISRRVQGPYLGYLQAQKQRLTGERGQKRIHRPELEAHNKLFKEYADGHFMTLYGDVSPPLIELLKAHAAGFKWFTFVKGLDSSSR